jgi:dTDP-4-amino-4,6-dideoxygalactose transaminase
MRDPVTWLGAQPVFYRLHANLAPELDDVQARTGAQTRALIVVHYFGFPQDLTALRRWCDARDIKLIEDCAHAFYGRFASQGPGSVGDYAIASLTKFFPVYDGGFLVARDRALDTRQLRRGGLRFQLKAAANTLEEAMHYHRLRPLHLALKIPLLLKDLLWTGVKWLRHDLQPQEAPGATGGGEGFDPQWLDVEMSLTSQFVFRHTSMERTIAGRRRNFSMLLEALRDQPGCHPLFPHLPAGVVPYVFPLYVDDPQRVFPILKMQGVPMFRWEDVPQGICHKSSEYSAHLLQFPCHEELRPAELAWMRDTVLTALADKRGSRARGGSNTKALPHRARRSTSNQGA